MEKRVREYNNAAFDPSISDAEVTKHIVKLLASKLVDDGKFSFRLEAHKPTLTTLVNQAMSTVMGGFGLTRTR